MSHNETDELVKELKSCTHKAGSLSDRAAVKLVELQTELTLTKTELTLTEAVLEVIKTEMQKISKSTNSDKPEDGAVEEPRNVTSKASLDFLLQMKKTINNPYLDHAIETMETAARLEHPAINYDLVINSGALTLALNTLRRANKHEIADAVVAACKSLK